MPRNFALPLAAILSALLAASVSAETRMESEAWESNDAGFAKFAERIEALNSRNLLARPGVKLATALNVSNVPCLTDGAAGARGADGRAFANGQPSVITFYLGEPKTIKEVGLFSFNGDTRSNQDYEVRFFDNSAKPGEMPTFRNQADLTTGRMIVGQDRGGFHTSFIDTKGAPLVKGKVDWVQFKVWRTYPVQAGRRAKTNTPSGGSTIIELEVLGQQNDIYLPPPEEIARRAAVRAAPKQPEFVEKPTWRETLIASREALLKWERLHDRLTLPTSGVTFGPWHVLGPFSDRSQEASELWRQTQIDLAARHPGKDGKSITWLKRDDLTDGPINDLAGLPSAEPGDVLFLCRPVSVRHELERGRMCFDLAADDGSARWLPMNRGLHVSRPAALGRVGDELRSPPGEHQLIMRLKITADGKCRFHFMPQPGTSMPGAGQARVRLGHRRVILAETRDRFNSPTDRCEMRWAAEDSIYAPRERDRSGDDWLPGHVDAYLASKYRSAISRRLRAVEEQLGATSGVKAQAIGPVKERLEAWKDGFRKSVSGESDAAGLRSRYHQVASIQELISLSGRICSIRLAVEDQRETFKGKYPKAGEFLAQINALEKQIDAAWQAAFDSANISLLAELTAQLDGTSADILLANPLLAFDKLLLVKGHSGFAANWGGPNSLGNEMVILSPVRPDGQLTTIHKGPISDMDLHWDGRRVLFSDRKAVWEIGVDGGQPRRVSAEDPPILHYDACYLPDGNICCVSNACEQAVPCTGGGNVGNLHVMKSDGSDERRVTYDQDHDWNPVVMNDGRVLYTRWEYTDTPHYFSRLLFRMNPDGTGQMEYYGSNSYWPNAMYWPRPIPGHPTKIVCVVSGHHGVSRVGELLLLDPAKGRHEADGALQRIPGYGVKVEPVTKDGLVVDTWPRFAAPYPLAEPGTNRGAGKYFLVCVKRDEMSTWDLYLVDVFDNMTPILTGGFMTPIPLRPRPMPPALPSHIKPGRKEATVYMTDVYSGPGLKGLPRGSIKRLRIGSHHYRFAGNGDTRASSLEGGWDVKKILGTVPVEPDGSAIFKVPANTPIFVQPLDAEGKAQQIMRSWFTAMPGEVLSCIGCHERQNDVPPSKYTASAIGRLPARITPWYGPARGFSFDRELQPVLDRRCVGCHNGQPCKLGDKQIATIDLRAKRMHEGYEGDYSPAYLALQQYVRRPGYESDYHMPKPAEYEADTSVLVRMLKKGHYNVELTREEWERLYTWIDFNIPYPVNWRESHRPPRDDQVARRVEYKQRYSNIEDRDEEPAPLPPIARFEPPKPLPARPKPLKLAGWPLSAEQAADMQKAAGPVEKQLDLGEGVTMKFALIPSGRFVMGDPAGFADESQQAVVEIQRPFYMGRFEVTNRQFARFNPRHDSGVINERGKDRSRRGTLINQPDFPVVRISWRHAMEFCRWLSERTGEHCTLPSEPQWEWACRAGTDTPLAFGPYTQGMKPPANIADERARRWNHGRAEPGYNDGVHFTASVGRFPANAWGLHDMHGNVAEWCHTVYKPYPHKPGDNFCAPTDPSPRVVRGGSWNDTLPYATSASRWRYAPHKPVYDVGFRVVFPAGSELLRVSLKRATIPAAGAK